MYKKPFSEIEKDNKSIGNIIDNFEEASKAGNLKKAEEILNNAANSKEIAEILEKNPSIIPKGFDVKDMFGEGAAGALIKEAEIGLKAGNIIPGMVS